MQNDDYTSDGSRRAELSQRNDKPHKEPNLTEEEEGVGNLLNKTFITGYVYSM